MDAADFKRKLDAARTFDVTEGGVTLRVRLPTETMMRACVASLHGKSGGVPVAELQPLVMSRAVIGWSGVRPCDLKPGAPETPLEFDAVLLEDVFDRWPDLYDRAYTELMQRYGERLQRLESERKNLPTMSVPS